MTACNDARPDHPRGRPQRAAAIADEMARDLQRTSYNMMIYEVRDYCCALLDTEAA